MRSLRRSMEGVLVLALARLHALISRPVSKSVVLCVVVVLGVFVAVPALAQTAGTSEPSTLDTAMLFLAGLILSIAQVLGQVVVLLLDIIIIPLMQYNGFSSSPIVGAGWSVTRDVVNMFFVIILIVIALGTILNYTKRFTWHQQVPRLLIFALIINFSRTLVGIMIDFGQVIMLTFVNALKDIAGGNFIQLLGLGDILSVSKSQGIRDLVAGQGEASTGVAGILPFDWLAASIAAMLMMIMVLAIVIILAAILAWRIVLLWVLIVLAPLAWFVGGAGDIIGKGSAYGEWWQNFTCAVAIGPVVTFFLWLTLAVAGSGNIAASEGFVTTEAASEAGFAKNPSLNLNKAFEVSRMTSFIIGIAMLVAGFHAANQICAGTKGMGGLTKYLDPAKMLKTAGRYTRGAAATTAGLGLKGAQLGVKAGATSAKYGLKAGLVAAKYAEPELQAKARKGGFGSGTAGLIRTIATKQGQAEWLGDRAQAIRKSGLPGARIGSAILAGQQAELSKGAVEERKKIGSYYQTLDKQGKIDTLKSLVGKNAEGVAEYKAPKTERGQIEMENLLLGSLDDKDIMAGLDNEEIKLIWGGAGKGLEEGYAKDPEISKKLKEFKKSRPHLTVEVPEGANREEINDAFENQSNLKNPDDFKEVHPDAYADKNFAEFTKTVDTDHQTKDGRYLSRYEATLLGKSGAKAGQNLAKLLEEGRGVRGAEYNKRVERDKNQELLANYSKEGNENKFSSANDGASVMHLANSAPVSLLAGEGSDGIRTAIAKNDGLNEMSSAVAQGISDAQIASLFQEFGSNTDADRVGQIDEALTSIGIALEARSAAIGDKDSVRRFENFTKNRKNVKAKVAIKGKNQSALEAAQGGEMVIESAGESTARVQQQSNISQQIQNLENEVQALANQFAERQQANLNEINEAINQQNNQAPADTASPDYQAWQAELNELENRREEINSEIDAQLETRRQALEELRKKAGQK